jgi:hypothetical protein
MWFAYFGRLVMGCLFSTCSKVGHLFWMFSDVGRLVMGLFESGTFHDGTFCMCTYPIKPYLFVNNTGAVVAH